MDYEDRLSIATPEGVAVDLTLAGLGSRFIALLTDTLIGWSVIIAGTILLNLSGGRIQNTVATVLVVTAAFFVTFGYHVMFETLASGRTPGKRLAGLRVVTRDGAPVGFVTSCLRNILRIVDSLPGLYLVGVITVLISQRNQRLGDIAAGTLVVRERRAAIAIPPLPDAAVAESWDVSGVTNDEVAIVRRYLARRDALTPDARFRLSTELAEVLGAKVVGADDDLAPDDFLERLVATKAARS